MARRSPTLEGFRAVYRMPSLALAEISWRWTLGFSTTLLFTSVLLEYLRTLPVSAADSILLSTRQPALISQAILHIFKGSAERLVSAGLTVALALVCAWIMVGALGRGTIVESLVSHFRLNSDFRHGHWKLRSLIGLNFLRAVLILAALVGCIGAILLGGAASSPEDSSPGSAMLIFLFVAMLVWMAWSILNWFLSLASVFVVADGCDTFGAVRAAVDVCRTRSGPVLAAGFWFGLGHVVAFMVASSIVAFPLAFASVLPPGVIFGGLLFVSLLYFALVDFLYAGRLAAYVAIVTLPDLSPAPEPVPPPIPIFNSSQAVLGQTAKVDQDEPILSDIPADSVPDVSCTLHSVLNRWPNRRLARVGRTRLSAASRIAEAARQCRRELNKPRRTLRGFSAWGFSANSAV